MQKLYRTPTHLTQPSTPSPQPLTSELPLLMKPKVLLAPSITVVTQSEKLRLQVKVKCCVTRKLRCSLNPPFVFREPALSVLPLPLPDCASVSGKLCPRGGKMEPLTPGVSPPDCKASWEREWVGYLWGLSTRPPPTPSLHRGIC